MTFLWTRSFILRQIYWVFNVFRGSGFDMRLYHYKKMLLTRTLLPLYFDIIIIHEWLQTQRIVQRSHNPTILFPQLTKVALRSLMQISFFFSVAELEPLWVKFQLNMSHMLFSVQLLQKFIPSLNFCWVPNMFR